MVRPSRDLAIGDGLPDERQSNPSATAGCFARTVRWIIVSGGMHLTSCVRLKLLTAELRASKTANATLEDTARKQAQQMTRMGEDIQQSRKTIDEYVRVAFDKRILTADEQLTS